MNKRSKLISLIVAVLVILAGVAVVALVTILGDSLTSSQKKLDETKQRISLGYHQLGAPPGLTLQTSAWTPEQLDSHPNWGHTYKYAGDVAQSAAALQSFWTAADCTAEVIEPDAASASTLVQGFCPGPSLYLKADFYNATTASIQASEEKI